MLLRAALPYIANNPYAAELTALEERVFGGRHSKIITNLLNEQTAKKLRQ